MIETDQRIQFMNQYFKQWAPIIPLWTGLMLKIIGEKDFLQNNQAALALFSDLISTSFPILKERKKH